MKLPNLFKRASHTPPARAVYEEIVAKARQPWLYASAGVQDSVTGRFAMITLHAFLVLDRLRGQGENAAEFSQELVDELFADMDRSLREMGVGDVTVGKKVRKMSEVFYGACEAYRTALEQAGEDASKELSAALKRNALQEAGESQLHRLTAYTFEAHEALGLAPVDEIVAGQLVFECQITED